MMVNFGFESLEIFCGGERGEVSEEKLVCVFAVHGFEGVEDLAVRGAFPDGEDHGFAEPALGAVFGDDSEAAVDFHGPLGGVDGKFGGPIFGEVSDEAEEMIAIGVGRALHPDFVEEMDRFPS